MSVIIFSRACGVKCNRSAVELYGEGKAGVHHHFLPFKLFVRDEGGILKEGEEDEDEGRG